MVALDKTILINLYFKECIFLNTPSKNHMQIIIFYIIIFSWLDIQQNKELYYGYKFLGWYPVDVLSSIQQ